HSYIDDDCWLHSNYIGDSIIGKGCNFGAGTVTANLRFDNRNIMVRVKSDIINTNLDKLGVIMGAGCKTGVNASIMPGVRIGNHSTIGANVSLTRDLEPNKMIIDVPQYKVIRNLF
ncbi:MAG: DapH/DapD/GlmU-related protein, partial [Chloroflexi bacterium]|nr:DapH/DapD/GlmU-related protein [Chloroflexota bacterium]